MQKRILLTLILLACTSICFAEDIHTNDPDAPTVVVGSPDAPQVVMGSPDAPEVLPEAKKHCQHWERECHDEIYCFQRYCSHKIKRRLCDWECKGV